MNDILIWIKYVLFLILFVKKDEPQTFLFIVNKRKNIDLATFKIHQRFKTFRFT